MSVFLCFSDCDTGWSVRVKTNEGIFTRTLKSLYLGQRVEGEVNDIKEPHIQIVAKRLTDQDQSNQHLG